MLKKRATGQFLKGELYCVKQDITQGSKTLHKTTELQLFCK